MDETSNVIFPSLPLTSRLLILFFQKLSYRFLPRGLPRIVWLGRRLFLGRGNRIVWYRNRFQMYCDCDSYPNVMTVCGFVYRHMERVLHLLPCSPPIFLDVGANVGFVSLLICSLKGSSDAIRAHCFEPDPGVFVWLSKNRDLNKFNMTLNPCAVGSVEGEAELTISKRPGWSTMAKEPPGGFSFLPKAGKKMVPVTTIDLYCKENKLTPSLIKIDVEGFESRVIEGSLRILESARPYLLAEINPLRLAAAGTSGEELLRQLSNLHYNIFHIDKRSVRRDGRFKRKTWHGLIEAGPVDLKMGREFDIIAVPK